MNAALVTDVCRICPEGGEGLLNIFDERLFATYNIKEVLLVTTGVEILEDDLVSKKICQKCCNITIRMFQFRQVALKQDRALKETLSKYLKDKDFKLPNTCVTIKEERRISSLSPTSETTPSESSTSKDSFKIKLHPSVADIYKNYPNLKLPKKCFERHMAPIVSCPLGDVESYFKTRRLDIKEYTYKPIPKNQIPDEASSSIKQKTVTPLRISKKVFGNNEESDVASDNNYVCIPLLKKRGRKRKGSLINKGEGPKLKSPTDKNVKFGSQLPSEPIIKTPDPEVKKLNNSESLSNAKAVTAKIAEPILPLQSEHGAENSSLNDSQNISINDTNKPKFIESLGLMSRIVATKSQTLHICNICASVHTSAINLKLHYRKHTVCQFCKRKFKSIDAKQNHVDKFCKIKRIMNTPGPMVALEKVHLNLDVRKKFINAFSALDPIPGLIEPAPLEQVLLEAASPPLPESADGVIDLSDKKESLTDSVDPLAGISTPSANMPPTAVIKGVYKSIAKMRPNIKIKNNTILNNFDADTSDKDLIKNLMKLIRTEQPATCEQLLQTNLPVDEDIEINNNDGTCNFKNLEEQLVTYKIPVELSKGSFNASYKLNIARKQEKEMVLWPDLPIIDKFKGSTPQPKITNRNSISHQNESRSIPSLGACVPIPQSKNLYSQVQPTLAANLSAPVTTATATIPVILPPCSTTTSTSLSKTTDSLINPQNSSRFNLVVRNDLTLPMNNNIPNRINTLTSTATPLQNGTKSETPPLLQNMSASLPKTYGKYSHRKSTDTLNRCFIVKNHFTGSSAIASSESVAGYAQNAIAHRPVNSYYVAVKSKPPASSIHQPLTNTSVGQSFTATKLGTTSITAPTTSNSVKFRVKKPWELQ